MRISGETVERLAWQERGLCVGTNPELYFPETRPAEGLKDRCKEECPVRTECLAYALAYDVQGIWGGTSTKERRAMKGRGALPATREPRDVETWLAS